MDIGVLLLGVAFAVYGAQLLFDGGVAVVTRFRIPPLVIGSTVVACVVVALNNPVDMVIGDVLGSNILDIFFTLAVTSLIAPVPLDLALHTAVVIYSAITGMLLACVRFSTTDIGRTLGAVLIIARAACFAKAILALQIRPGPHFKWNSRTRV